MPTLFEIFGFSVDDRSQDVEVIRKSRQCPFMGATCDGGGNRYQTKIKLTSQEPLTHYFNRDVTEVIPGVCSIQAGEDIWVVCPRRKTENSTDIRSAFRNSLLKSEHSSPGINKRQVWGRMVTQLFAKTVLANKWNGKTIWIIQDTLLKNIELTTRLRTVDIPNNPRRNISLAIMDYSASVDNIKEMSLKYTIDGDAGIDFDGSNSFTDILLPKIVPPKVELLKAILRRKLDAIFRL